MKYNVRYLFGLLMALSFTNTIAQPTVRFDATKTHQCITGFGGFVCSPQFQYGHMSTADIKKVWGAESTVGCNIMRMYIPIGKNTWSQSLSTAKTAKQMGLIVFASLNSQAAFVPIVSDALGITTITSEGEVPIKVFDLQGRQISNLSPKPGIYIKNGRKIVVSHP